ncbi:MAG TPA: ATP-grasp fold amidoligase family protein [Candidatus Paceibacterota bacterium]|nr:ATP-grasp fold amidoligase family protein [Candidatus Paceibacterota bacterium]
MNLLRTIARTPSVYTMRGALFNLVERLDGYRHEKAHFKKTVGYEPHVYAPRTLNEKIVWKKLFDRNPLLPLTVDKYRVRDYVRHVLGEEAGNAILAPLLFTTDDPSTIPFDTLPEEYVIKTNHGGGQVIIVTKDAPVDRDAAVRQLRAWLAYPYSLFEHEWAYWPVKRRVVVEGLLREADGDLVQDYKLHIFHGKCRFIHTTPKKNAERSGKRSLFTPEWQLMPVGWLYKETAYVEPPPALAEMIRIAEALAAPFPYARVDLYNPHGKVYLGEITHYHGGGYEPFYPESFDFEAGSYWHVVPGYWKLPDYAPWRAFAAS